MTDKTGAWVLAPELNGGARVAIHEREEKAAGGAWYMARYSFFRARRLESIF